MVLSPSLVLGAHKLCPFGVLLLEIDMVCLTDLVPVVNWGSGRKKNMPVP